MRVKTIFIFINIEQLNEFHYIILFKCFNHVLVLNQLNLIHPFLSSSFSGTDFYSNWFNKVSWKKSESKKESILWPKEKQSYPFQPHLSAHCAIRLLSDLTTIWPTISFFQSQVILGHLLLIYKYDTHIGDQFV